MKKIILCLITIIIFVSCKSNEKKALELIDRDMFKTLYDYSSYEPVETKIDSAFTTIYRDSLIMRYTIKTLALVELSNESMEKAKKAGEYAEIYAGSYYSYSRFKKYKDEALEEYNKTMYYIQRWKNMEDTIAMLINDFKPEYIGWEVKHKFRCKSKGGNFSLGNYIYIIDPKFKEITHQEDAEDETINKIKERIDIVMKESTKKEEATVDELEKTQSRPL